MISATLLRAAKLGDVAAGNIVIARYQDQLRYGIHVQQTGHTVPHFVPLGDPGNPETLGGNVQGYSTAVCLDLGRIPLVQWDGSSSSINELPDDRNQPEAGDAKLGQIYLGPNGLLLCLMGTTNFMWNLKTRQAEQYSRPKFSLSRWQLGVPDDDGKMLHVLAHFPDSVQEHIDAVIEANKPKSR